MVKHFWVWAGSKLAPSLVVCGCFGLGTRLWVTIMGLREGSEALGYSKLGLGQGLCQNFWFLSLVQRGRGGKASPPTPGNMVFCGSFWLGLSMRLVTTLPQGLTSYYGHLAGWLCPRPPQG